MVTTTSGVFQDSVRINCRIDDDDDKEGLSSMLM